MLNVGWTPEHDMDLAADADVDVTVFTPDGVRAAQRAGQRLGRRVHVHWKLDTGMGRLGTPPAGVEEVFAALKSAAHVHPRGVFTHFAAADAPALEQTHVQHGRFLDQVERIRAMFPDALLHCANSAAMLRLPLTHHDMTRPGIALYGYPPAHCDGIASLRPALTVKTVVTQVKRMAAGDTVGYGGTWSAPVASAVATLAVGYADGFDRRNGVGGQVIVNGVICPVVGRVSMDQAAADVSGVDGVVAGTEVTVLGPGAGGEVDAAAVAQRIGTIPNEVLCAVAARVPRIAVSRSS